MTGQEAGRPSSGRLEGLDALRALLMIGGLLIHGSSWQEPTPLFDAVALISHSFRMGCFFAISGFLAATTLRKRPAGAWLRRRTAQIGLPLLFGLVVICPLISLIIRMRPAVVGGPDPLPFDWYHLWFLVALLLYSPIAAGIDRLETRGIAMHRLVDGLCLSRRCLLPLVLSVGAASFLLMIAAATLVGALAPPRCISTLNQWRLIAGYLPIYLFGFALARSAQLQASALQAWRSAALVVAATVLLYAGWYGVARPLIDPAEAAWRDGLVELVGASVCPPAAFILLFRFALAIRRVPAMLHRLAQASLTIYLVHLPLLVAINLAFRTVELNVYLEYAIAVTAGLVGSYAVHRWIVQPSAWLSLVVNGRLDRLPRRRRSSMDEAGHDVAVGTAHLHLRA